MLTFGSLFAGIGGFDLGFERASMQCKWQVEVDDYATKVLEKHWPKVTRWRDVRTFPPAVESPWLSANWKAKWGVDVICGGFPCQDISVAGKRAGIEGERSGLWSEFARIIRILRPRFVVIENSPEIVNSGLSRVLCDLAESGLDVEWQPIRASDFTLPHRRERAFIIAYTNQVDGQARVGDISHWPQEVFATRYRQCDAIHIQAAPDPSRVNDGISGRAYRDQIERLGNAVSPVIAQWIGERLVEISKQEARA